MNLKIVLSHAISSSKWHFDIPNNCKHKMFINFFVDSVGKHGILQLKKTLKINYDFLVHISVIKNSY
jgi:hypothetical protein